MVTGMAIVEKGRARPRPASSREKNLQGFGFIGTDVVDATFVP
jgi:hypothetical protein